MPTASITPLLISTLLNFLNIYLIIIFVRLLLTWFPNIDWMQQIIGFLSPITDPYLNLFRFIPPMGMMDISPIFAILALQVAMQVIAQVAAPLMMGF
jgi:YggT family protein